MKKEVLSAMFTEMEERRDYLSDKKIETIYFGGGTPSILENEEIAAFIEWVRNNFILDEDVEITLEANPDDLNEKKISALKHAGINRLSIGIQSFRDKDLQWMNRIHSSQEAIASVIAAQKNGIKNISIDLIYGIPGLSGEEWNHNLDIALSLNVPHISAYCLTVEKGTALDHLVKTKKAGPVNEEDASSQFLLMMNKLQGNDFIAYEISNFGKNGFFSRHNSSYWKGKYYLGIGPSAHSYNGISRSCNISSNSRYVKALKEKLPYCETEILTVENKYNEYLMTSLRTIWGINDKFIIENFNEEIYRHFTKKLEKWKEYLVSGQNESRVLTHEGRLLADRIISELFI